VKHPNIDTALAILTELGFPRAQLNARSALTLLALADVPPDRSFAEATGPLIGITPIMEWVKDRYGLIYAPNTRETFRRQTMHQFLDAGLVLYNPDKPDRAVNSPMAVYQLSPEAISLLRQSGTANWQSAIHAYLELRGELAAKYASARKMELVPVVIENGLALSLSPGAHSQLIRAIIEDFAPRFAPASTLLYAGDTGQKFGHFNKTLLAQLGVTVDSHGKMPDVALYFGTRDWLILVEAVTSHGPVDAKRHGELMALFGSAKPGLVYVTAFPDRATMARYVTEIAWETEVWVADAPSHLIHFNGVRFLGPYSER
jgi:BsuBI/PstI restriction endonuclease domain/BsuBI/PstI restriction endonuclease HTH domain